MSTVKMKRWKWAVIYPRHILIIVLILPTSAFHGITPTSRLAEVNMNVCKELMEINRVLKPGGKAIINLIYSLELKEPDKFKEAVEELGFKIVEDYSGEVTVGDQYRSRVITLEKVKNIDNTLTPAQVSENLGEEKREGLKFSPTKTGVKNSRRIVTEFELGAKKMPVNFNEGGQGGVS